MAKISTVSAFKLNSAKKTTWIFGAGASTAEPYKVPMQSKVLEHFFTMSVPGRAAFKDEFNRLRDEVRMLCERIQPGIDPQDAILEEVFSAYEIESRSTYSSFDQKKIAIEAINKLRKALRYATQAYGNGQAAKWRPHNRNNKPAPYAELLEKLFPVGCSVDEIKSHTLVTMNYDINLDRCIINMLNPSQGELYLDYGIDFGDFRLPNSFTRPKNKSVLLLRLHGGLNWLRCKACQAMFTTIDKHARVIDTDLCRLCKSPTLDQVIVHPSYTREYTDPILNIIWGRLYEELVSSDRWVFIGYSLPTADVHLREVLRHSHRVRTERKKKTRVVWVGKKVASSDPNWDQLAQNYYSVFKESVKAWKATPGGFADFVRSIQTS